MPHTPGPWHTGKSSLDRLIYADSEHAFDLAIVRNGGNDSEVDANANLIAASPEMLTALEECVTDDDARAMTDESRNAASIARRRLDAINKVVRAAIAKARGQ